MFADGGAGLKRTARGIVIHRAGGSSVQQALCASRGLFWVSASGRETATLRTVAPVGAGGQRRHRGARAVRALMCACIRRLVVQITSTLGAFTNDVLESKFRACICACIRRLMARNPHSVHLQTTFWRANSGRVFARVYDVSRLEIHTRCIYKRRFREQIPGVYLRVYTTSHGSKSTLGAFTNDVLENKSR